MIMELVYRQEHKQSLVTFGEPLNKAVPKDFARQRHVIILTNQKYYDRSFEKITQLFQHSLDIDWYICRNQLYSNNMQEFQDILAFLERFPRNRNYLFCSYGNEGVTALTGFLDQVSLFNSSYCCFSVSLRSLMKALVTRQEIVGRDGRPVLQVANLPERIFFDQTLTEAQGEGKLVDFLLLIRCGLVCSQSFLQELFQNFPEAQQVTSRSFVSLVPQLATFYQEQQSAIESYGKLFEQAFYETSQGHLLSANMKRFWGILFHLLWNQQCLPLDLDMVKFWRWLQRVGLPLRLPAAFSFTEYGIAVLKVAKDLPPTEIYHKIGQLAEKRYPTNEELMGLAETYQEIMERI